VLGVLTNELGVAVSPTIDEAVLERLDLLQVSTERLLLVLALRSGAVRTIFVEVPAELSPDAVQRVTVVLNERVAGLTLKEIRATLADRLRDASPEPGSSELLNIFVQEAEELFDVPVAPSGPVHLGSTQPLAGQPEFSTRAQLHGLIEVTERRDLLRDALTARGGEGLTITIGQEHADARLAPFTLVTSTYRFGLLTGVIGVMGPTRMPYDKIAALVNHTSRLVGELLE
jgi:heat-inducible transcriptional repressor